MWEEVGGVNPSLGTNLKLSNMFFIRIDNHLVFDFGKYKGEDVNKVAYFNIDYIDWCYSNIKGFRLPSESISSFKNGIIRKLTKYIAACLVTTEIEKFFYKYFPNEDFDELYESCHHAHIMEMFHNIRVGEYYRKW